MANSLTANAIHKNQIEIGRSASLWFQTSARTIAGTISSDKDDVLFGTQVGGRATVSTIPLVARQGLSISGGTMASSVPVQFAVCTYASLPGAGAAVRQVFCTNSLKPAEAADSGTDMIVQRWPLCVRYSPPAPSSSIEWQD